MRTLTQEEMSEVAGGFFFRRSRCGGSRTRYRSHYSYEGRSRDCNPEPECQPEPPQCEPEPPKTMPDPPACGEPPVDETPAEPPVSV
ncbi:hypothetical protein [Hydrogenophaga sp. 5NK40-0174]|uniref:hypothetical protein n=1 Tax=Hydrogenophaga sp. 5NK40-0174 TaxID=3127649 RepID=UPI00333FD437